MNVFSVRILRCQLKVFKNSASVLFSASLTKYVVQISGGECYDPQQYNRTICRGPTFGSMGMISI